MKNKSAIPAGILTVGVIGMLSLNVAEAALDEFEPYAFTRVLHDTNLFRVSGDQEAIAQLGDDKKDDTIAHLGAGFRSDWKLSRQHLLLKGELDRAQYDTYDDLDHTRLDGDATWAWQVGNLWSGKLGYRYEKSLSDFNEQRTPEKDMKTRGTFVLDGGYEIHPDWRLVAGLTLADVSYDKRDQLDRKSDAAHVAVQYRNTRNTRVGVRVRYSKNDLKDQQVSGVTVNNDYDELNVGGLFYWEGTGKSSLEAYLGYTEQYYDELAVREYNGTTGSLTYHWIATGKTKVDFSAWRETSTLTDEISTYVLTKGASIKPVWSVTPKISLNGELSYSNDDFKGENDIRAALGGDRRDDDTWLYGVWVNWSPRDYLGLSVGYRREDRDSSIDSNDFDDQQLEARAQLNF